MFSIPFLLHWGRKKKLELQGKTDFKEGLCTLIARHAGLFHFYLQPVGAEWKPKIKMYVGWFADRNKMCGVVHEKKNKMHVEGGVIE